MNRNEFSRYLICDNIDVSEDGHLLFAGRDTTEMIKKYGSPMFLMDEERIRHNCRVYRSALERNFGSDAIALYASKAASFKRIYEIVAEEGLGCDVVSCGEIFTATRAGFPLSRAYFHSNNKTDADIEYAIDHGVGYLVCDNEEEVYAINRIAGEKGIRQKILLRLTPGIDPHTYAAVATGKVDSKFGSAIETGQAEAITRIALAQKNIILSGFHCHVGSQVFDAEVYLSSTKIMLDFLKHVKKTTGYEADELDLGGGFGVRYVEEDPTLNIGEKIDELASFIKRYVSELGLRMPAIRLEPGRSIIADTCLTLYTVGTVKRIPGYKSYVSVDGGMTDNPRFALYGSRYTVLSANKATEKCDFECSVVGRCCESGDIIQENVKLPSSITRNDIIAVLTTGAYNYSMSSNYNRIGRLPIVMLNRDGDYLAVRRESLEDIARNDI
ncbi:MAG: diaminopimelate decarboxylase [Clostridia bacterium]|nr:diaminopimelate decarboxylase [Clostridia bacterium]